MKKYVGFLCIAFLSILIGGCASPSPKVERIGVDDVKDLSGKWNDTDSKLVSNEMVDDMLSRQWLAKHTSTTNKMPNIIVGSIRNLSHEHVNVSTFVNDIQREIINSGSASFVADSAERGQIRDERFDQDLNASEESRKAMGQELGADFMLIGSISTIIDAAEKMQIIYYQVDLKLVSLADNRTVWIGQKKIKKLITGRSIRY